MIEIPEALRPLAGNASVISAEGDTLEAVFKQLNKRHQILVQRVLTRGGDLRPHVNIFVNKRDARITGGLATPLSPGDIVAIVPAVSGG